MTHTTEPWHNSPLPEGVSHTVTVLPGGWGVGRSGGPSGQTWTGPQDGDLQSGTDDGGHGGAGSSGGHGGAGSSGGHGRCKELWKPWRCRELRRPWRSWELRRPWRSWELRRPWWCRELRRPWQVVFHGLGLFPRPGHSSRNPSTPPQKKFPGEVRGYQESSGARQTGTGQGQDSPPGLNRQEQDSPQEQEALLG